MRRRPPPGELRQPRLPRLHLHLHLHLLLRLPLHLFRPPASPLRVLRRCVARPFRSPPQCVR